MAVMVVATIHQRHKHAKTEHHPSYVRKSSHTDLQFRVNPISSLGWPTTILSSSRRGACRAGESEHFACQFKKGS